MLFNSSFYKLCVIISTILLSSLTGFCQQDRSLDHDMMMKIVNTCITAFEKHYVYPEMIPGIEEYIRRKIVEGHYKNVSNLLELTKQLRKDFRHISDDRHIWIDIMQNIPVKDSDVSDEEKIKELKKTNFGFVKFEILEGNIAYLRLDGFKNLEYAEKTAAAVMCSLAYSDAIIFDLRFNHGGNGNMVHFISSYFFEKKTQLTSLYFREADSLATAWTDPDVPGKKLLQQPLFILTSKNTASAAESFAYTMKNYNRATIVGEYTRGAGHWNESYQFPQLGIFLEIPVARPINPVTNTGWEGKGVRPDVEISEKDALDKAYHLSLVKKRSP